MLFYSPMKNKKVNIDSTEPINSIAEVDRVTLSNVHS